MAGWKKLPLFLLLLLLLPAGAWLALYGFGRIQLAYAQRAWEREIGPLPGPPLIYGSSITDPDDAAAELILQAAETVSRQAGYAVTRSASDHARSERGRASAVPAPPPAKVLGADGKPLMDVEPLVRQILEGETPSWQGSSAIHLVKAGGLLVSDAHVQLSLGREDTARRSIEAAWKLAEVRSAGEPLLASRVKTGVQLGVMGVLRKMSDPGPAWVQRLETDAEQAAFKSGLCGVLGGNYRFYADDRIWGQYATRERQATPQPLIIRLPDFVTKPLRLTRAAELLASGRSLCNESIEQAPCSPLLGARPSGAIRGEEALLDHAEEVSDMQFRFSSFLLDAEFTRKLVRLGAIRSETGTWPEEPDWFEESLCPNVTRHYDRLEDGRHVSIRTEVDPPRSINLSRELPLRYTSLP